HGARPVLHVSMTARLCIVSQAPGLRVHETGLSFNDRSGDRLREWLKLGREQFYDTRHIAIIPAGFCYPGTGVNGDMPPRPECAPLWHPRLRALLPHIKLTLLVGNYAQAYYLGDKMKSSVTETVRAYQEYLPEYLPLPHPSPRNRGWLKSNPWFVRKVIPQLRLLVSSALK
ncbi:MAG: uracil-DNA glycosylase family protein, partial [Burkholderiales bacterium]